MASERGRENCVPVSRVKLCKVTSATRISCDKPLAYY